MFITADGQAALALCIAAEASRVGKLPEHVKYPEHCRACTCEYERIIMVLYNMNRWEDILLEIASEKIKGLLNDWKGR